MIHIIGNRGSGKTVSASAEACYVGNFTPVSSSNCNKGCILLTPDTWAARNVVTQFKNADVEIIMFTDRITIQKDKLSKIFYSHKPIIIDELGIFNQMLAGKLSKEDAAYAHSWKTVFQQQLYGYTANSFNILEESLKLLNIKSIDELAHNHRGYNRYYFMNYGDAEYDETFEI